jgi:hypothetical protein
VAIYDFNGVRNATTDGDFLTTGYFREVVYIECIHHFPHLIEMDAETVELPFEDLDPLTVKLTSAPPVTSARSLILSVFMFL